MTPRCVSIAILLCTHNGAPYLREQLDSLRIPEGARGAIYASDDASSDSTRDLIRDYAESPGALPVELRDGPALGHARNFLSLLCADDISADAFALCDQDDIWDADKLDRALAALASVPGRTPALYCSRTRAIDDDQRLLGLSPLFSRPPTFRNALVHNIAGGNTMVLNAAARELVRRAGQVDVVTHDWWIYQLVTGAGGVVLYDPQPSLSYRQHAGNVIGANLGLRTRALRYRGFLGGRHRAWHAGNLAALRQNRTLLNEQSRELLDCFEQLRSGNLVERLSALVRGRFYAQSASGNVGLWCATLLKKI